MRILFDNILKGMFMIETVRLGGKFLDQPLLVAKFKRVVPAIFTGGAVAYGANEIRKAPKSEKKNTAIYSASVLGATLVSALTAPRLAAKIVHKPYNTYKIKDVVENNTKIIDEFISENKDINKKTNSILDKAKDSILSLKEIKILHKELSKKKDGQKFFNKLIPEPDNITSKDIISEIGRLSILGAIPVVGGIAGGIAGENITTGGLSKEKTANRVKEGAYQYLANIFMCNVGAAMALGVLEKFNVKSKAARVAGMVGGIIATGIVGGSTIANYIGRKVINPIFDKDKKSTDERKPEVLDICLHSDDIATIAVMSGLKWIEPSLPILYGISGYRAGIGYRNSKKRKNN